MISFAHSGCSAPGDAPVDRVILVTLDTVRADYIGSYGATQAHTPNFDTVAAEGVRFDVAISPTPLTLPSHASLMTALDPPAHGVRHNGIHRLSGEIPTLAGRLRAAGFATAAFVGALVLDARFGLDRGFDVYDDTMSGRLSGRVGYAERTADAVADAALAWLDRAPERFFLWLHFYDAHAGYDPPPGFASAFASRPYQGEIAFVDSQFGRVLAGIRSRWPDGGTLLVNFRVQAGDIWFDHADFGESCRLVQQSEGDWHGTCPPDQESDFDAGLTITLYPPPVQEPSGNSSSGDATNNSQPGDNGSSVDSEEEPNKDTDDSKS